MAISFGSYNQRLSLKFFKAKWYSSEQTISIIWSLKGDSDVLLMDYKVVSSNPVHGELYPIQHYVIKFVSLWFSPVSSTNRTNHHDITEILLKVALIPKPYSSPWTGFELTTLLVIGVDCKNQNWLPYFSWNNKMNVTAETKYV
jgi:hypothetical protein